MPGTQTTEGTQAHYDDFSRRYDLTALILRRFHRQAVAALGARPGDTVYDLGCGTGLLFERLVEAVGPTGRVIGVDLSAGMLDVARARVEQHGWDNVEIVQADLTAYTGPEPADAAIFCLSLSTIPVYEAILARCAALVKPGRRIVVADSWKHHSRWYHRLSRAWIDLKAPYVSGIPDNRIGACVEQHLERVTVEETMLGVYSIATGYSPAAQAAS